MLKFALKASTILAGALGAGSLLGADSWDALGSIANIFGFGGDAIAGVSSWLGNLLSSNGVSSGLTGSLLTYGLPLLLTGIGAKVGLGSAMGNVGGFILFSAIAGIGYMAWKNGLMSQFFNSSRLSTTDPALELPSGNFAVPESSLPPMRRSDADSIEGVPSTRFETARRLAARLNDQRPGEGVATSRRHVAAVVPTEEEPDFDPDKPTHDENVG